MNGYNSSEKYAAKIALLVLALLAIGAAVFYKLRMSFLDAPYIAFNIINTDALHIQEHRYGAFITQAVPLLAARMGLSVKAILVGYSLSFTLFYLLVALLLVYKFKEYGMAVLMACY